MSISIAAMGAYRNLSIEAGTPRGLQKLSSGQRIQKDGDTVTLTLGDGLRGQLGGASNATTGSDAASGTTSTSSTTRSTVADLRAALEAPPAAVLGDSPDMSLEMAAFTRNQLITNKGRDLLSTLQGRIGDASAGGLVTGADLQGASTEPRARLDEFV